MFLIINSNNQDIKLILVKSKADFKIKQNKLARGQAEELLPMIDEFLKKNKIGLAKIKGIGAVSGPGGFTSLRITHSIANALSYALKIPVVGIRADEFKDKKELVEKIIGKIAKAKSGSVVLPFYEK